jgi:Cu-Zn family superoxide dismutase
MPVLLVTALGVARTEFVTDRLRISPLFDTDGSAIIIHASPDNYANIPTRYVAAPDMDTLRTGDAGGRVACGILEER